METNQRIRQIIKSQTAPYPPQGVLWVHEVEGKQVKEVWKNGGWYPVETISLEEIWDLLDTISSKNEPIYVSFDHGEDGEVYEITDEATLKAAYRDGRLLDVVLKEQLLGDDYVLKVIGYRSHKDEFEIFFVENYQNTQRVRSLGFSV